MAEDRIPAAPVAQAGPEPAPRRPLWQRVAGWIAIAAMALGVLLALVLAGLDTALGHRFLAREIGGYTTQSGVSLHVARLDGSIYGRLTLTRIEVRDQRGTFLAIPRLAIDWRPFHYLGNHLDVRAAIAARAILLRSPALRPTPPQPNAPLLPNLDLTLGRLKVDRLTIAPAVDGKRHLLSIDGGARLAAGRARIAAQLRAIAGPGLAGGDALRLVLDAVPKADRLRVDVTLAAPAGGFVDSYAHLGKALALKIDGHGDWAEWHGTLRAAAGAAPLATLALGAAHGHLAFSGRAAPNAILAPGPATRLTAPAIALDGAAVLGERRADVRLAAHSAALTVAAAGLVDLANSRLGQFHIAAQLLTPGAIAAGARGRDVRLAAVVDGPLATPTIDYRLSAAELGFNTTAIAGLSASGRARIDAQHIIIPVSARARAVTGLNAAVGGLATGLTATGTLAYAGGRLITDDLHLRSPQLDATVLAIADFAHGHYAGAFKGRVNDYRLAGVGRVALEADAHLVPAAPERVGGGFGLAGWLRAKTRSIDNPSVRRFLGGNAALSGAIAYSAAGVASIHGLVLRAPAFHLAGDGVYLPSGQIRFRATANSTPYGPLALALNGTAARPLLHLHADRPNLGVQAANVDAQISGNLTGSGSAGYDVRATGGSAYGPFAGDVRVTMGKGPLRLDIRTAQFAGVHVAGGLTQAAAGPFVGGLALTGSGFSGRATLAAVGKVQRAEVALSASAAHLPGPTSMTLGAGHIRASLLLTPGAPAIQADARVRDLRLGAAANPLILTTAEARVRYAGGRGTVALVTAGHASVPFTLAAQAALDPARVVFNARGSANTIAFHLAAPTSAIRQGNDWRLLGATIVLPQGQVALSGVYGAHAQLHAALANFDLSIVQAVVPGLGVGGKATGTIDIAMATGGAIPASRSRLDIAGFTRTGALTVSAPLDIALLGTTGGNGATLGALIRERGATLGRVQLRVMPGGGVGWVARLMHGGLSGGIRYAGPAELLWTLSGIAGQDVSGPIGIAADFAGTPARPTLTGIARATQLRYENETYGTAITGIALDGRFTATQFLIDRFAGHAGSGTITAQGSASIDAAAGYPINLGATLTNARLAKSDALGATVTGQLAITNSRAGGQIKGDIALGNVRYQIIRQGAGEVPELTGVHRKGQRLAAAPPSGPAPSRWALALRIHAPGQIYVAGMGLEAEWATDMRIGGTVGAPRVVGELDVVRGTYSFAGKSLALDDQSKVTFDGGPLTDPLLAISANTTTNGVTATVNIAGRAQAPQITFTSIPALPQDEVLARLLFGSSVTSLSPIEAVQLAAALNSLRGSGGGFNPLGKLRGVAGFDRLRVLGANPATGQGTSLAAGKYLARHVYIEVITDARGFTATQLDVALSKALSLLSSTSSFGDSNAALRYRRDH